MAKQERVRHPAGGPKKATFEKPITGETYSFIA
jgi:hypothetical protein